MRRKVIQIADSTQLVSLPRKWALKHGIKKGQELEIEEKGNQLTIYSQGNKDGEKVEINVNKLEPMTARFIHALYKRGVDEIRCNFENPSELEKVQSSLGKETVGYEIVEQGKRFCLIKNVSGDLESFDPILRRIFLLLISMAEEGLTAIKEKDAHALKNLLPLEESNNRFTTTCRRYLNKKGHPAISTVGPLYYIIEDLENLADQYKYMYKFLIKKDLKKIKISEKTFAHFQKTTNLLKMYYELFYKPDKEKISEIGNMRKEIIKEWYSALDKTKNSMDVLIGYHMLTIAQKIFNLTGPLLAFHESAHLSAA